ncbi:hypothetical protein I7X12_19270 [Halosimplex litoreum]|uniref:Uncharacterized protein n=1 Tax=Halosimplex litoreum TaxID=1198301 RepID=A0A7U3WTC6_9EURY|nr:hypothetical protein [Halosimplex litoreum]QPV65190.1 hypothetical protein I7X12_19270 [Halosimplex litoreum]
MVSQAEKWWEAIGVSGAIILGLVLFFFPEPATSVLGVIIIVAAAFVWLAVDIRQERRHESELLRESSAEEATD